MSDQQPWLIVGLGNPGPTYALTRHNIGARVVDELAQRASAKLGRHKVAVAQVAECRIAGHKCILVQPWSYMNTSGGPVKALMTFYKIPAENLIVLHDELDIPMNAIRIKHSGGDNGHNGLKSIRSALGTGDWYRVRLGIGRPVGQQDPAEYVLKAFGSGQAKDVAQLISSGADAVEALMTKGLDATQSEFNS